MKSIFKLGFLSTFCLISFSLFAQDRHFAWTYESTTLPKGATDIEVWGSFYIGQSEYYNKYKGRIEFEHGITDKLQTAVYMNGTQKSMAELDSGKIMGLSTENEISISNEWKLNILNPSVDAIGLGLYGEITLSSIETELEAKILLDKKIDKLIFAYNLVGELAFEKELEEKTSGNLEVESEKAFVLENYLSTMYMVKPSLGIGAEFINENEFSESELESSVLYGGLSFFWSTNNFFLIGSYAPQFTDFKYGGRNLEEQEKLHARILFGFSF